MNYIDKITEQHIVKYFNKHLSGKYILPAQQKKQSYDIVMSSMDNNGENKHITIYLWVKENGQNTGRNLTIDISNFEINQAADDKRDLLSSSALKKIQKELFVDRFDKYEEDFIAYHYDQLDKFYKEQLSFGLSNKEKNQLKNIVRRKKELIENYFHTPQLEDGRI